MMVKPLGEGAYGWAGGLVGEWVKGMGAVRATNGSLCDEAARAQQRAAPVASRRARRAPPRLGCSVADR